MPYGRYKRKRIVRGKRRTRKMYRKPLRMVKQPNFKGVYHFKRTYDKTVALSNNLGDQAYGYAFSFSELPNFSEFTSLFDSYRINKVVIRFRPLPVAGFGSTPVAITDNSQAIAYIDYDDNNTAGLTIASVKQHQNIRFLDTVSSNGSIPKKNVIVLRPRCLQNVNDSGGTSYPMAYRNGKNPWMDMAYTAVSHFGVKLVIGQTTTNQILQFQPIVTIYFSCKDAR